MNVTLNVIERHVTFFNHHRIRKYDDDEIPGAGVCVLCVWVSVCVCVCVCVCSGLTGLGSRGTDPAHSLRREGKMYLLIVEVSYTCTLWTIHFLTNRGLLVSAVYSV